MKVRKKDVLYIGLIFSILINDSFFQMADRNCAILKYAQVILILVLNGLSVYYSLKLSNRSVKRAIRNLYVYIVGVFAIIYIVQYIVECVINKISVSQFIAQASVYYYILLLSPIYIFCITDRGPWKLLNAIMVITCVKLCIVLIIAILYNLSFLNSVPESYRYLSRIRDGRLRIHDLSVFLGIAATTALQNMLVHRKYIQKLKGLFCFFIISITCFYVQQTRMINYILILMSCMMILQNQKLRSNRNILYFILGFIIIAGLMMTGHENISIYIYEFIHGDISKRARIEEIKFAIKEFIKSPLTGYGITKAIIPDAIKIRNTFAHYSNVDIGAVGSLAMIGVGYIFIFFIPLIRYLQMLFWGARMIRREYIVVTNILAFLVCSSITLVVTDGSRIYAWPYYLAVLEYFRWKASDRSIVGYCRKICTNQLIFLRE